MRELPWNRDDWHAQAEEQIRSALTAVGRPPSAPPRVVKSWGRSCIHNVPTEQGVVWVKHAYRLPPGEERVVEELTRRWSRFLPGVLATWEDGYAMETLPGSELQEDAPVEHWKQAASALGELAAGEAAHIDEWLALGVRDRRVSSWRDSVEGLVDSDVVQGMDPEPLESFQALVPEFIDRFVGSFESPPTLVHQDSGCCNIHVTEDGPVVFDWSDVVVGHPVYSCDRLLDQVPRAFHDDVIEEFLAPLDCDVDEFRAMRRSNVLHEVLRYFDELEHLPATDEVSVSLRGSIRSQIEVLVAHETR